MAERGGDRFLHCADGLGDGEVEVEVEQRDRRCAERALVAGHDHGLAVGRERDRAQLSEDVGTQLPPGGQRSAGRRSGCGVAQV